MSAILKPQLGTILPGGGWRLDPLARGLVGYWSADGSASAIDLSGNGNHGTFVGDTHCVPGKFGHAWDFDGTGDYVGIPSLIGAERTADSATYCFWLYCRTKVANDGFLTSASQNPVITCDGTNVRVNVGAYPGRYLISMSLSVNEWIFYVVTYQTGTGIKGYKNGVFIGEDTITDDGENISATSTVYIASDRGIAGRDVDGQIDNVMIFDRVLSAAEIGQLYQRGGDPFLIRRRHLTLPLTVAATSGGAPNIGYMTPTKYWGI